jgi:hypothetical protein
MTLEIKNEPGNWPRSCKYGEGEEIRVTVTNCLGTKVKVYTLKSLHEGNGFTCGGRLWYRAGDKASCDQGIVIGT